MTHDSWAWGQIQSVKVCNPTYPKKKLNKTIIDEAKTWPHQYAPRQRQWTISETWYQERKDKGGFYQREAS